MVLRVGARDPRSYESARLLRREGEPIKRIAKRLGFSPSTIRAWTADIRLTRQQQLRNLRGPRGPQSPERIAHRVDAIKRIHRDRRLAWQGEGRAEAKRGSALHLAGCMLHWAEGSKDRNRLKLVNSDREMVRFYLRFLRECLAVADEDVTLSLNVYLTNGLTIRQIEDHWLWALELPRSCLRKHQLNHTPTSSSGRKRNKLPYGVCTLTVHSTRLVQHIYGAIQEYAGFDEPRWLDGPPRKRARPG